MMKGTRRQFLKTTGAAGLAAGTLGIPAAALNARPSVGAAGPKPRRVIFLVSDGMSMGALSLADLFSRQVRGRPTHFHDLINNEKASRGLFLTHSLNSLVTDSAAAASAWGSGSRVFNNALNMLPDGRALTPIHWLLKEKGHGTGLVTTVTVTHATPAGFAAAIEDRGQQEKVAEQYAGKVDVLLGGGRRYFEAAKRGDGRDLVAEYAALGHAYWTQRSQLPDPKDTPEKILGLFSDWNVPYTLDQAQSEDLTRDIPTLAEMTSVALAALEQNPRGFLLQVEGAMVDWAAHWNDTGALLWDQLAFDDAIGVALEFQRKHPETLIVATSDHGNANPGLNGMGAGYLDADKCFARLQKSRGSYYSLIEELKETDASPATIKELVKEKFGIGIEDRFAEALAAANAGEDTGEIHVQQRSFTGILGQVLGNHTGIGWTGATHTEDPTVIAALGPGQGMWEGMPHLTDGFVNLTAHFGIDYRNPSMTPEEAREFAWSAPAGGHEMDIHPA